MKIKWNKIFDWSVCGIQMPYPLHDLSGKIYAYRVDVQYTHHGLHRFTFRIKSNSASVLSRANKFAQHVYKRIQIDREKAASKLKQNRTIYIIIRLNNTKQYA